ncbi:MAG: hypothetical protein ACREVE_13040 [Gammaproteobacteria bacterium]
MMQASKLSTRLGPVSSGWLGPWIRELCVSDLDFSVRAQDRFDGRLHYLAIVNRVLARSATKPDPKEVAALLRAQSRKKVLRALWPDHPRGLLSALQKMGFSLHNRAYYDRLLQHIANPVSAKALRHSGFISPFNLKALDMLDPAYHTPRLIWLLNNAERLHTFLYMTAALERILPAQRIADARRALYRVKAFVDMRRWFSRWMTKGPVPRAPWPGTARLVPLDSVHAIVAAGERFGNCLGCETPQAVAGVYHFYEWRGREAAVISIERDPLLGWVVGRIRGIENRALRAGTRDAIVREFAVAGIAWRPDAADWFDRDDFRDYMHDIGHDLDGETLMEDPWWRRN